MNTLLILLRPSPAKNGHVPGHLSGTVGLPERRLDVVNGLGKPDQSNVIEHAARFVAVVAGVNDYLLDFVEAMQQSIRGAKADAKVFRTAIGRGGGGGVGHCRGRSISPPTEHVRRGQRPARLDEHRRGEKSVPGGGAVPVPHQLTPEKADGELAKGQRSLGVEAADEGVLLTAGVAVHIAAVDDAPHWGDAEGTQG